MTDGTHFSFFFPFLSSSLRSCARGPTLLAWSCTEGLTLFVRRCIAPVWWSKEGRGRLHGGATRPCGSGRYATGAGAVLAARRLQDELRAVVAEVGGLRLHSMARQGGTLGSRSRFVCTWRGNQQMGASFLGQQESGPGRRFRCPPQIGGFSRSPAGAAFFIRAPRFKYGGSSRGSAGVALTHL